MVGPGPMRREQSLAERAREKKAARPRSWPWDEVPCGWDEGMAQQSGRRRGRKEDMNQAR